MRMKRILSGMAAVIGLLAFTAEAQQTMAIHGIMNVALVCQVQQDGLPNATTTNLAIRTQSLLKFIANDQGFALPANAKLWFDGSASAVLRANNTIFTNIDTNILNITYGTTVLKSKLQQTTKTYVDTIRGKSVVTLNYNGSAMSFNLNVVGENGFYNTVNYAKAENNAVGVNSFSGSGFGSGMVGDQSMVVTGTVTGRWSFRYTADGEPVTGPSGLAVPPDDGDGSVITSPVPPDVGDGSITVTIPSTGFSTFP